MTLARLPGNSINGLRLGAFILASVAVHGLLLSGETQETVLSYPATASLSVTIVPAEQKTNRDKQSNNQKKETLTTPLEKQPIKPEPVKAVQTTAVKETAAEEIVSTAAKHEPSTQENTTEETYFSQEPPQANFEVAEQPAFSLNQAKQQIRKQLHNDLGRHFRYPGIARKRGWEGTVLLDLFIETDGRISKISLARSSGYRLLDNSAIKALNKVGSVTDAARWLQGHSLKLQLPVIYHLTSM